VSDDQNLPGQTKQGGGAIPLRAAGGKIPLALGGPRCQAMPGNDLGVVKELIKHDPTSLIRMIQPLLPTYVLFNEALAPRMQAITIRTQHF
jgi:hypothetical protein